MNYSCCREVAEILAVMRKAEWQERQRWEAARLARAEAPDQARGKKPGQKAQHHAPPQLAASSAKSGARRNAQLAQFVHAAHAEDQQHMLSPVTPPPVQNEPVNDLPAALLMQSDSELASAIASLPLLNAYVMPPWRSKPLSLYGTLASCSAVLPYVVRGLSSHECVTLETKTDADICSPSQCLRIWRSSCTSTVN